MSEHQKLLAETRLAVQKSFPNCRLFVRHVGLFYRPSILSSPNFDKKESSKHIQRIGIKGEPDLSGFIKIGNYAVYLGIEIKTGNAKQTKEQKAFQKMVTDLGGIYIVGRSVEQVIDEINIHIFPN